jgi:hypothetical protein
MSKEVQSAAAYSTRIAFGIGIYSIYLEAMEALFSSAPRSVSRISGGATQLSS